MVKNSVIKYDQPWQETETFLKLLPGPRFSSPPRDERGVVIRHYSTTISRNLRGHPKGRVDVSDPDDREYIAKTTWRRNRPAYVGVLLSRVEPTTQWCVRRADGRRFPVHCYRRTNAHIEYRQALWCEIEGDDRDEQIQRLNNFAVDPTMAVWSGNVSLHAYWVLSKTVTVGYWDKLMRSLCAQLRGNRRVLCPMQQMQLPGGVHEKTGKRAKLIAAGERYYRGRQIADAITLSNDEIDKYFDE